MPDEPSETVSRPRPWGLELRLPPPLLAATAALLMWAIAQRTGGLAAAPLNAALGAAHPLLVLALTGGGGLLALLGVAGFRRAHTTMNPMLPAQASVLVTTGIYSRSRNPMYLGLIVVLLGWSVELRDLLATIPVPLFAAYLHRYQVLPEERALRERFGSQFLLYTRRVRRWI